MIRSLFTTVFALNIKIQNSTLILYEIHLLILIWRLLFVKKGSSQLWRNMWEKKRDKLWTSLWHSLPSWTLSSLYSQGWRYSLLLQTIKLRDVLFRFKDSLWMWCSMCSQTELWQTLLSKELCNSFYLPSFFVTKHIMCVWTAFRRLR